MIGPHTVTVAICFHNEQDFLGRCLASVAPFADALLLCDNGSSDGSLGLVAEWRRLNQKSVTLIHRTELHPDKHCQELYSLCRTAWILVLGADEVCRPDFQNLAQAAMALAPEAAGFFIPLLTEIKADCRSTETLRFEEMKLRLFRAGAVVAPGLLHENLQPLDEPSIRHVEQPNFEPWITQVRSATEQLRRELLRGQDYYRAIPGYFDFGVLYDWVVAAAPTDRPASFVELGNFFGRSTIYLAERIKNSGKPITLYTVDTFPDILSWATNERYFIELSHKPVEYYVKNLVQARVTQNVVVMLEDSARADHQFDDGSVDFVYVDADHTWEAVQTDIEEWLPKIRPGGILAGHDYLEAEKWPGVREAVEERFAGKADVTTYPNSWVWRV